MKTNYPNILIKTFQLVRLYRSMSVFIKVLNPVTGQYEWDTRKDDYDYHQEVACAGFGDMLHDTERNQKYFAALRKTIAKLHEEGREAHVLDIGTGTGILAMMAVEAGADTVTACEAFMPMANCAERIIKSNRLHEKIRLVKKRSTQLKVGTDMSQKANLLVTEVLDTELIGEGAISIYNHAHEVLLTEDVVCIPARAICYAQVATSPLAAQWNTLKMLPNLDGDVLLEPSQEQSTCKGEAELHDVQLSQLPLDQFLPLMSPLEIFKFDFSCKTARKTQRKRNFTVKCKHVGTTDLVFYWWKIDMDVKSEVMLSCAPFWEHPDFDELIVSKPVNVPRANIIPWRDHWMQAIYYIPKPLQLNSKQEEFILNCNHDEYSLWFDVFSTKDYIDKPVPRHSCTCNLHITYSRSRIGQMNQSQRNKRFMCYLEQSVKNDSSVLSLGDSCVLGLSTAKLGAVSVFCHEPHRFSGQFMKSLAQHNNLENVQFVDKLESLKSTTLAQLTHVFAEPYFLTSILPWDNFYFGSLIAKILDSLSPTVEISPHSASIIAVPVEFLDLHKIRAPIGNCEGFDLSLFDEMVDMSSSLAQAKIEAQPLWEYPCRALAYPQEVLRVIFRNFEDKSSEGVFHVEVSGSCNGIALWVDWNISADSSPKSTITTGPTEPISPGQYIKWDMFVRQGVFLIGKAPKVIQNESIVCWNLDFKPKAGQTNFHFHVKT